MNRFLIFMMLFTLVKTACAQTDIYDSGGSFMPEQAAYDVKFYDLTLQVFPSDKRIDGTLQMQAKVVQPMYWLVMDLDTLLAISSIQEAGNERVFHRDGGKVWIDLTRTRQPGESIKVQIAYGGKPRPAPMAPWQGGFSWSKTPSGADWIATSCEGEGADIWWPCKDDVSDKPDSMRLHIRVPDPLIVASNGKFIQKQAHNDGTSTYEWFSYNPLSNYNIALNIAPYRIIEDKIKSVAGDEFPVIFYVLPEDYDKGVKFFPEIIDHLHFFEKYCGPYPFRADKYGVAQTPHLGMEHQTIIAYGANFRNNAMTGIDWGFDALHQHECAHEWWGNLITNFDWRDMWLHEGFASYMQPLYMEEKSGKDKYHEYMNSMRHFSNKQAIAPRESKSSDEIYKAPIYDKGAWVLHTLRFLLGDDVFFRALRRMAYPDPAMEKITNGSQCRFVTTDDFLHICEQESGKDLDWFFEVYLRQPALPKLYAAIENNQLTLRWQAPDNLPFTMPIEVAFGGKRQRIDVTTKGVTIPFEKGVKPVVDPDHWGLFENGK